MGKIAEKTARQPLEKHVYQNFADDMRHISGARFVVFELSDAVSGKLNTVALAGRKQDLDKISTELGYEIIGKSREYPDNYKNYSSGIVFCDETEEFISSLIPFEKVGGDEFIIILPKTDKEKTELIVERINKNIEEFNRQKPEMSLSLSLGIATADKQSRSLQDTFKYADKEMYKEKNKKQEKY